MRKAGKVQGVNGEKRISETTPGVPRSAFPVTRATVFVIDDDPWVRKGVSRLLRSAGYEVETFASARDFLDRPGSSPRGPAFGDISHSFGGAAGSEVPLSEACCLVLDIRMPGLSGLDLQNELAKAEHSMPIVFITGHGDVPTSVMAMRKGAVDFLTKPFDQKDLLAAVRLALDKDREARRIQAGTIEARDRIATLTSREREVLARVTAGHLNKQIAAELGICEATVKVHRGRVMRKIGVWSVADLVRVCERGVR
jgi:FixJ family two-component response regulator